MRDTGVGLSERARSLWGKTNREDDSTWLPLYVHMADSAAMAEKLWDCWLPRGTREIVARDLGDDEELARKIYVFLAGIHDIGKATPVFQAKPIRGAFGGEETSSLAWKAEKAGLPMIGGLIDTSKPTHPIAGEVILERYLRQECGWNRKAAQSYACVVGGHHGTPPSAEALRYARCEQTRAGLDSPAWSDTQTELLRFLRSRAALDDKDMSVAAEHRLSAQTQVVLTGLVIMADWIASNSDPDMFPLVPLIPSMDGDGFYKNEADDIDTWPGLRRRAERGWACVNLPHAWEPADIPSCEELFGSRFHLPKGASIRPMQREAMAIAQQVEEPGLMVIEAPMGEGKTEAALAAAEVFAKRTGRGGVCVALPTMATTDAMFSRVRDWLAALPQESDDIEKSMWLAHGKAQLNKDFRGIIAQSHRRVDQVNDDERGLRADRRGRRFPDAKPEAVVSEWLWGRKRGALANFLVCTVDQVLMGALQMKHVVLRQLALANKVVIIDECHAYDAYMQEYLRGALGWLGACRTPVILLSATLPERQRRSMIDAYLRGWNGAQVGCENPEMELDGQDSDSYPLITYTSGGTVGHRDIQPSGRKLSVACRMLLDDDDSLVGLAQRLLREGGCLGVICDSVRRAQHAFDILSERCGDCQVKLTHSRFMDIDRMSNETELRELLGPHSTVSNGKRPERLIVVGTQVLEQSLDIDFDALITDIAPVDLLMQRVGRLHRHHRGEGECERPAGLRKAVCHIRGITSWENGVPSFDDRVERVYSSASLMEALAVTGLTTESASSEQSLPEDIARTVREAYGDGIRSRIPEPWLESYDPACAEREREREDKRRRAEYISRIALNMARFEARQLVASPYRMHAAVESSFPPDSVRQNDEGRILWRLDEFSSNRSTWLYVVSPERPDFTHIVEQAGWPLHAEWETKDYAPLLERIAQGQCWQFKLRANPVRTAREDKGRRQRSSGIVGKVQGHVTVAQQTKWLLDRAEKHGFRVLSEGEVADVVVSQRHRERFQRGGDTVTLTTVTFEGRLEVTDASAFRDTLCHGLGRAKGFGCGLMTVAPIRNDVA